MSYSNIYFLGIGGIGMSALARYFLHEGRNVGGYDRIRTPLTERLEDEGAHIHYHDNAEAIPSEFRCPQTTLVVYTPAVPPDHPEMIWFRENGFRMEKRSEMLGELARGKYVMAVAGTHGKTTTTTLLAWLNHCAGDDGSAFLGGISKNFDSNLVLGAGRRLAVEADEFDRSFLQLLPDVAVITSTDPDHLDIYGDHDTMLEAFRQFGRQCKTLIIKDGIDIGREAYTYSLDGETADFRAEDIELQSGGYYCFDIRCPDRTIRDCTLGIPGIVNVENTVAAVAVMWVAGRSDGAGFDEVRLRDGLATFKGVRRRFDFWINTPALTYMDDYAHHPRELTAAIGSLRDMFPERRLTAVFQPHLYTRTRDFYREFGEALSLADDVVLLPIYPAREMPIEGITSETIGEHISVHWEVVQKENLAGHLAGRTDLDVVVTFGAGDIENYCAQIAEKLRNK
ncbi:MAG: UDP-N-acetylmuramate--L-alanine ligase [Rikenellaceae bacterium]|nr:UDP-N-acetylmuramate--L-alanine ligase [Rikenellaceae bacterium]MCL2693069.1 UDP-N-acetylmuramate--L-alanine ligase [Rikenellaceae bacterium]